MNGEKRGSDDDGAVEARIPDPLWERVRTLFVAKRGYEPSSVQEALGVVCDLAQDGLDDGGSSLEGSADAAEPPVDGQSPPTDAQTEVPITAGEDDDESTVDLSAAEASNEATKEALGTAPQPVVDAIDDVFPSGWDDQSFAQRHLPAVVDEYVDCADGEADDPESRALDRVAERTSADPDEIHDRLVGCVYRGQPLPDDVAADFFSEALEVVAERLASERDSSIVAPDPVDVDLTEHGGLSAETTFEGTPMESPELVATDSESVSFDELVDDLDATSEPIVPGGTNVESLLDTSHADSKVREVAGEVLDEMTGSLFDELENGVDHGTGAGVADGTGDGAAIAGEQAATTGSIDDDTDPFGLDDVNAAALDSVDESTDEDGHETESDDDAEDGNAIPGPLSVDPETDCDQCGDTYRVSELDTTLSESDGTALLLCPDCRE